MPATKRQCQAQKGKECVREHSDKLVLSNHLHLMNFIPQYLKEQAEAISELLVVFSEKPEKSVMS